jgi:hypothetical protein
MSETLLKEISKKLDTLIAMTASQGLDVEKKIKILSSLGMSNNEIGKLTGMTGENVRLKLKKK